MVCELCVRHRPDIRPGQSGAEVGQARRICDERIFLRARQALDARLKLPRGRGRVGRQQQRQRRDRVAARIFCAACQMLHVLPQAACDIRRHARVERAVGAAQKIDIVPFIHRPFPLFFKNA